LNTIAKTDKIAAPTNLRVTGYTSSSITLAWDPPPGAWNVTYSVYKNNDIPSGNTTATEITISNLAPDEAYLFYVTATDNNGTSGRSNPATGRTSPPPIHAITARPAAPHFGTHQMGCSQLNSMTVTLTNNGTTGLNFIGIGFNFNPHFTITTDFCGAGTLPILCSYWV